MKKNNYQISHTSYQIIDKFGNITEKRKAAKKITYNDLLYSCDIGLSSVVIKKNIK